MFHFPEDHRVGDVFKIGSIIGGFNDYRQTEIVTIAKFGAWMPNKDEITQVKKKCFDDNDLVFACRAEYDPTVELHRFKGFTWN